MKRFVFLQPFIYDQDYMPSLGVLTLASIMETEGWEVRFFDEHFNGDVINSIINFRPSILGISALTACVLRGRNLATQIKAALPDTIIVFGGPHPTALPEEVLGWESVDFVIVGEAEYSLLELGKWFLAGKTKSELKNISNLCYKIDGNFVQNKMRPFLQPDELDRLPLPSFHLLDLKRVFERNRHGIFQKGKRTLPIMGSRGCPNDCTFCCRMMGYKIRYRDPELLVNEISKMVNDYNLDEIFFEDDNFTVNRERALAILDFLIKRNLGIYIKFPNGIRADGLDRQILEKMKQAGCYSISMGIESGSERVLEMMQKNLSLKKVRENVQIAKSMGFLVGGNCVIGYPGETIADVEQSLDFFMGLDLDSMAIVNLIPYPGTESRRICQERGYLTPEADNWDNYFFDINNPRILIETEFLTGKDIKRLINWAYRRMYLNPKKIYNILRYLRPMEIIKGIQVMLSKLFQN